MSFILVKGVIFNPLSDESYEFYPQGYLLFRRSDKKIISYGEENTKNLSKFNHNISKQIDLSGNLIIPPFFDMHFHWVQDKVRTKSKSNLLDWLHQHTFPQEQKFASSEYSLKQANKFFEKLAKNGTLGGAIFCSIHEHTLLHALKYAKGNFIAGNVLMTQNSPEYLLQDKDQAKKLVEKLAGRYKHKYAFTPRFAISCDMDTMKLGHALYRDHDSFIQTHLSETKKEINFTRELYSQYFQSSKDFSYTKVYEKAKLLKQRTLLAHGIHLSHEEYELISKRRSVIVHCPTSNAPKRDLGLGSGKMDLEKIDYYNIRWVLGSDIGAGPFLSMIDVMNSFVSQHKKHKMRASYMRALYRSTFAAAKVMGLSKIQGNFKRGKMASFLSIKIPKDLLAKAESSALKGDSGIHKWLSDVFFVSSDKRKDTVKKINHVVLNGKFLK